MSNETESTGILAWLSAAWRRFQRATPARKGLIGAGAVTFIAGVALLSVGLVSVFSGDDNPGESHVPRLEGGLPDVVRSSPTPSPTRAPTAEPSPSETPRAEPLLPEDGYRIIIERLGIDTVVDTYGLDENAIPEVPTGDDAAEVVAWYNFSARPGTGGNAVFAGHNSWFGDAVFTYLHELQEGDVVRLVGGDGAELTYTVTSVFSVDPEDPESLRVMHQTETDVVTLITCGGSFVDTDDPVFGGEFTDRVIVRADLTSATDPVVSGAGG